MNFIRLSISSLFLLSSATAQLTTSSLDIEGMNCEGCAQGLSEVLKETNGVKDAELNFENKHIDFTYDPEVVKVKAIKAQIAGLGYSPVRCNCSPAVKAGRAAVRVLAVIGFLSILVFSSRKVLQQDFLRKR